MGWQSFFQGRLLTRTEVLRIIQQESLDAQQVWDTLKCQPAVTLSPLRCCRCHNEDPTQFHCFESLVGDTCTYCLACLSMGRCDSTSSLYYLARKEVQEDEGRMTISLGWQGQLSTEQQRISEGLVAGLQQPLPQLVWAVTGAGKTEMLYAVIQTVLQQGGLVGLASPRVDVCLELVPRLAQAFPTVAQQVLYGDNPAPYQPVPLTIATTHQLLRCRELFDLLIVDEVDAFPYVNSPQLHTAVQQAVTGTGHLIYLTATPDKALQRQIQQGQLHVQLLPARYHRHPLPEPSFYWCGDWRGQIESGRFKAKLWQLLSQFLALEGSKLIFMPQIELAEQLAKQLRTAFPKVHLESVHAQDPNRHEKVQCLRRQELDVLVTTTILERGVTFVNCHVCILGAEHSGFSESALVQMSGRVGRNPNYPTGALWWLHQGVSRAMRGAKSQIVQMNRLARERGLLDE